MLFRIPFYIKKLSWLYPVSILRTSSTENAVLELAVYKGEWQLNTADAQYSGGTRYRPLTMAFGKIQPELQQIKNVLVLGAGLGSAVSILHKMHCYPSFTLVELDEKILEWAKQLLPRDPNTEFVLDDAMRFIEKNLKQYDLVVIDIFKGRKPAAFVADNNFLDHCIRSITSGGHLIINYMINDKDDEKAFRRISEKFSRAEVLRYEQNRILIAKA